MEEMTLREVCNSAEVTRRAVQGYEKTGLVMASGKNERGYRLYDMHSLERIKRIKLYQQFGFTIKEIQALQALIDAPDVVLKAALEAQIVWMQGEQEQFGVLIGKANELIKQLC
ncbi:MAG: MerR family transcriptional regulator [Lachnospiraceae bacterium]|nr:MerR family transcriptional regulator [Lachnospiraceae bacterium]